MTSTKLLKTRLSARTVFLAWMALCGIGTLSLTPARAQDSQFGWHSDLKKAAEISAKTNKPIFLVFRCVR